MNAPRSEALAMHDFLDRLAAQGERLPVATGLDTLDGALGGGLDEGNVGVLGGIPGVGKTAFLQQWALRAVSAGRPAILHTNELSPDQIRARMIAGELARDF